MIKILIFQDSPIFDQIFGGLSWNVRAQEHFLESEQQFFVAFMIQSDQKIVDAEPENVSERD